jgi:hypothetical protein
MFTNPFILGNIIPVISFAITYISMNYLYGSEKFRSILRPDGRKHYGETSATSNLIKTIQCVVALMALTYYYITDIRHGNYPNIAMRSIAMNYAAVELLSLIKAKKYYLRKDIAYHHYSGIFFGTMSFFVDFNQTKAAQMLLVFLFIVSLCVPYMIYNTLKAYYKIDWLRPLAILSYLIPFPIFVIYSIVQWKSNLSGNMLWFALYWIPIAPMLYTNYVSIKYIIKRRESFTQKHGNKKY